MHWDTLKQDNDSTVRGDGGGRVGEVLLIRLLARGLVYDSWTKSHTPSQLLLTYDV